MRNVVASIDIGSKSIKILLSEVVNGKINVLDTKVLESKFVKSGQILDQLEVSKIIREGISEIAKTLRVQIKKAILVLPSANTKILTSSSKIKVSNEFNMITKQDIEYVNEIAKKPLEQADVAVVSSFPYRFTTQDGQTFDKAPLGYQSETISVEVLAYGIPKNIYTDYVSAVNLAGIEVIETQISALAFATEAITEFEKEKQAVMLEVGHTTTTISAFNNSVLVATKTLPIGGKHITDDIEQVFGIDTKKANKFKENYGAIGSTSKQPIHFGTLNGKKQLFTLELLGQVIEARVMDILDEVKTFISEKGLSKEIPLVITGGGSDIEGIKELASKQLNVVARRYRPDTVGARISSMTGLLGSTYAHYVANKDKEVIELCIDIVELELLSKPEKAKSFIAKMWERASERKIAKERV